MNQNIEYEKFTQKIYQELINARGISTSVKHDVKLIGRSGQKHQIDVYWEYSINGIQHKVAIECKNYKKEIPIGKVRDFYGILSDLTDVSGIMITEVGYQKGAKKYADYYRINLKELRTPCQDDDCRIAETRLDLNISLTQQLFSLDADWVKENNIDWLSYRNFSAHLSGRGNEWGEKYLPLETIENNVFDEQGKVVATLDKLAEEAIQQTERIFEFKDVYVNTRNWGKVKIKSLKYVNSEMHEQKLITLDAQNITKAILKDALSGEIILFFKEK